MHKWLIITLKNKFIYDSFSAMITGKLFIQFQEEIKAGKIDIQDKDWNEKDKGIITVEMFGTEDEIKAWTKKTWREKIGMGMARMALKIDVVDA
jgi:hypothetical protein